MRFNIVGAGPAGLYFAYLIKRSFPGYQVRVFEQNAASVTFGFGVVFSGRALSFLAEGNREVVDRLARHMESWTDQHIVHEGVRVVVDGSSYTAIERLTLLNELQDLCLELGVVFEFNRRIAAPADAGPCDVLVAADGTNSAVRNSCPTAFGTRASDLRNYFAWYGVAHPYSAHTLTFRAMPAGVFCAHHYRYKPTMSTFVAEVDDETWHRSGMAAMDDAGRQHLVEAVFRDILHGKPLVNNRSIWRRVRLVTNDRWYQENIVLIGDALRTAHYSIGSGTRLAMEDSIALWRAFVAEGTNVGAALERYQAERKPVRDKLNRAAELSIAWYEDMAAKMRLPPYDFAYDYLLRTRVMTPSRLTKESPRFIARYREASMIGRQRA